MEGRWIYMFATEVVLALVLSNPLRFEKRMLSCSYAFKIEVATPMMQNIL